MNTHQQDVARVALDGAELGEVSFPQSAQMLIEAGFDGYAVDFRRSVRTYYLPNGEALELPTPPTRELIAARFDMPGVQSAIREAQALVPGYTYHGFCAKVSVAGCAGYMVSFLGKRVVYYGRTGETHVEHFPGVRS